MKNYKDAEIQSAEFRAVVEEARQLWSEKIEAYIAERGDRGSCVLGAGIYVNHIPKGCRNPRKMRIIYPPTPYQGSCAWEHSAQEIVDFLKSKGIECFFEYGVLD